LEEHQGKSKLVFEPLGPNHDRAAFSCGSPKLDTYLQTQAGQDGKKNLSVAFILTPDSKTIAGYYTLSQYSVKLDDIPEEIARKLTRHNEIPATLLGRLARSQAFRRMGLGEMLLMDALHRCLINSRQVASWAVIVDAKDDAAIAFYRKYGFIEVPKMPNRLFLPMATVAKMFA
jgi:ribosomal protein S18 acetylase RimI-like enzyme